MLGSEAGKTLGQFVVGYPPAGSTILADGSTFDPTTAALAALAAATAATPPRIAPLILDLDGDGIETTAANRLGAHFDMDGNGFAESVGWVSSDDGILVRDLNADGVINNGTELFGDQTMLKNGQKATSGFAALAA